MEQWMAVLLVGHSVVGKVDMKVAQMDALTVASSAVR
jgi:hypothetical protein